MTEQEAKTKWCPFVRAYYAQGTGEGLAAAAVNSGKPLAEDGSMSCIGSACMMWRWQRRMLGDNPMVTVHPDGSSTTDAPKPEHGHCGLAGPQ